jgi:hypothetical protein
MARWKSPSLKSVKTRSLHNIHILYQIKKNTPFQQLVILIVSFYIYKMERFKEAQFLLFDISFKFFTCAFYCLLQKNRCIPITFDV